MNTSPYNLSPFFRDTVGFDRILNRLEGLATGQIDSYPPYNIEKTGENAYRITLAVAGFEESELTVTSRESTLLIAGKHAERPETAKFMHKGIARRAFERTFTLAEHVKVSGATLQNGLLMVDLVREVPEEAKPRQIEIRKIAA
jgi:molecular chaperone IbpA